MPEASDVMRRGDAHIQEKRPSSAATVCTGCRERNAVRHARDVKCLNQRLTVGVVPSAPRMIPDWFLIRRTICEAVHVDPLSNDAFTVRRLDDRITGAVP